MKIAVIGYGWLGLPLATSLKDAGHELVGTCTSDEKAAALCEAGLEAVKLNLNGDLPQDLTQFFEGTAICILNFPPTRRADAQGREAEIDAYGQNALKAVSQFPAHTKFIFVSSTGVYPDNLPIASEAGFDRTQYVKSNSMAYAEEALHQQLGDRLTIVRMAGLIGGDRQIGKYFAGRKNIPNGDSPVNLIHQQDCIRLIERIIERKAWGEVFNGCASKHPSRRAYYTACCAHFGLEAPDFPQETDPVLTKQIDNRKSKQVLDFVYRFDDPYDMNQG